MTEKALLFRELDIWMNSWEVFYVSLVLYLIKFEILPDPVVEYLDAPFVPSWAFSFGQILGLGILIGLVFWISVFVYSVGVLRKGKMEWIRLTFEEHMKLKSKKVYVLRESLEC